MFQAILLGKKDVYIHMFCMSDLFLLWNFALSVLKFLEEM